LNLNQFRARIPAAGYTQLDADEPARSPVFCRDFLHDLDLEVAFGNQLLEPSILGFELLQPVG